jgi:hypothetical protein
VWRMPSAPPSLVEYQLADPPLRVPRVLAGAVMAGVLTFGTLGGARAEAPARALDGVAAWAAPAERAPAVPASAAEVPGVPTPAAPAPTRREPEPAPAAVEEPVTAVAAREPTGPSQGSAHRAEPAAERSAAERPGSHAAEPAAEAPGLLVLSGQLRRSERAAPRGGPVTSPSAAARADPEQAGGRSRRG